MLALLRPFGWWRKKFFNGDSVGFTDISFTWMVYVIPIYEEITKVGIITEERFPMLFAWMKNFASSPVTRDHLPPRDKLLLRYQKIR